MTTRSVGLIEALEPAIAVELERHLSLADPWQPHEYVPWSRGRDFASLGGIDWEPEQSELSPVARAAMMLNLLTEDNLPSYHSIALAGSKRSPALTEWVHRWTAEEARHSIVMRDYLVVTRGVDPVELEQARMAHLSVGWPGPAETDPLAEVVYTCMQEVATRIAHRNTGKACGDPVADRMLARIARDENLHQIFYRNVVAAAFEADPDYAIWAVSATVRSFVMPGVAVDGFRRAAVAIARAGIYDLVQHQNEVVRPLLRHWRVFERDDYGPAGERSRDELAAWLDNDLNASVRRFVRSQERSREHQAAL